MVHGRWGSRATLRCQLLFTVQEHFYFFQCLHRRTAGTQCRRGWLAILPLPIRIPLAVLLFAVLVGEKIVSVGMIKSEPGQFHIVLHISLRELRTAAFDIIERLLQTRHLLICCRGRVAAIGVTRRQSHAAACQQTKRRPMQNPTLADARRITVFFHRALFIGIRRTDGNSKIQRIFSWVKHPARCIVENLQHPLTKSTQDSVPV